jgi:hypothetical protein
MDCSSYYRSPALFLDQPHALLAALAPGCPGTLGATHQDSTGFLAFATENRPNTSAVHPPGQRIAALLPEKLFKATVPVPGPGARAAALSWVSGQRCSSHPCQTLLLFCPRTSARFGQAPDNILFDKSAKRTGTLKSFKREIHLMFIAALCSLLGLLDQGMPRSASNFFGS